METYSNGKKFDEVFIRGIRAREMYKDGIKFYQREMHEVELTNLIRDGSFESGLSGWGAKFITGGQNSFSRTILPNPLHTEFGGYCSYIQRRGSISGNVTEFYLGIERTTNFTVEIGRSYYIRAIFKCGNAIYNSEVNNIGIYNNKTNSNYDPIKVMNNISPNIWNIIETEWIADINQLDLCFFADLRNGNSGNATRIFYIDNICLIPIPDGFTYFDARSAIHQSNGYFEGTQTFIV